MGLQANYLTSLGLNFATCKMGIIPYRLARMVRANTLKEKNKNKNCGTLLLVHGKCYKNYNNNSITRKVH